MVVVLDHTVCLQWCRLGLRLCVSHWTQPVFDYLLTRIAEGARSLDARGYKVAVFYATNLRMYVDQASDSSLHAMGNLYLPLGLTVCSLGLIVVPTGQAPL